MEATRLSRLIIEDTIGKKIWEVPVAYEKYIHMLRVCNHCESICNYYNISGIMLEEMKYIAMLHDVGRVKQILKYNSVNDDNMDHAEVSYNMLMEYKKCVNRNINLDVVATAIANHNKMNDFKENNGGKIEHIDIIKDADKIDIMRQFILYSDMENKDTFFMGLDETNDINELCINRLFDSKLVDIKTLKNKNDYRILVIAWIHDIRTNYTKKYIIDKHMIDKIIDGVTSEYWKEKIRTYWFKWKM